MGKILFLYEIETPTVSNTKQFFEKSTIFKTSTSFCAIKKIRKRDIKESDVLVLIRPQDYLSYFVAKKASKRGKFVAVYCDDDLLNRTDGKDITKWKKEFLRKSLTVANLIWSSSERICEKYKGLTKDRRAVQMDTIIRDTEFRTCEKKISDEIRIVYAANPDHVVLFDKYIKPILPRFSEIKKSISFTFIGVHPNIDKKVLPPNLNIKYIETMPFAKYRTYMNENDFDIGLAPIYDDEFSKCKYINKYLEYGIFQIPAIFSNLEPYNRVVEDEKNGFLVNNTPEQWYVVLKKVIEDRCLRETCGENAINSIKRDYSEEHLVNRLRKQFPELFEYKTNKRMVNGVIIGKLIYCLLLVLERIIVCMFYLRYEGVKGVINKIRVHIKERISYHSS